MKLIVGLGNPGAQYETSRHNVGFMVLDLLADELGIKINRHRNGAFVGEGLADGQRVLLVKPQSYMNLSGQAVAALARWYRLQVEDIIVVHDDLDLDLGRLRLRGRGGAGGHRGIGSLMESLGSDNFSRVKVGIGRPPEGWDVAGYVLGAFPDAEWEIIRLLLPRAAQAARALCTIDLDVAMSRYNS
ncbi:MAG: aminoacyl-tRNA hydrolase [Bacillota bacterium]